VALIRTAVLCALIYLAYLVAFPDWGGGRLYHSFVPFALAGGVVGLAFLQKILDVGEGAMKLGLEAAFLAVVAVFLGYTMPQSSGKAPLTQWAEGARPNRDAARRGLERLHADPNGAVGSHIVALFPK
jgi:hypothetical protein